MKSLRRLAILVLPIVATISLSAPANATPNAAAPLALVSYVSNETDIGHGVKNNYDLNTPYDAILLPHRRTDGDPLWWSRATSFYIGPGHCAVYRHWESGAWRPAEGYKADGGTRGVIVLLRQSIPGETTARWAIQSIRPGAC